MGLFDKFKKKDTVTVEKNDYIGEGELTEAELENVTAGYPSRKGWLMAQIQKLEDEKARTDNPDIITRNDYLIGKYNEELDGILHHR